jgi:2-polyprenyl-3-methyl-5-hydroxy-6-metoxy-1,4-benzoquinol methylase
MASGQHEHVWESVPPGALPSEISARRSFLLAHVRARAATRARPRVLDVGCGEGYFTALLAQAGAEAVGVDVAQEPLRRARERHPELDLRLLPRDGPWPLADASFDVVWAGEVIEHVADTASWLSEVRRVLRSGGELLLSTPAHGRARVFALALSARRFARHFDPRSDHVRFYSARTLRALLADFRFEEISVRGVAGPPGARRLLLASARRARF